IADAVVFTALKNLSSVSSCSMVAAPVVVSTDSVVRVLPPFDVRVWRTCVASSCAPPPRPPPPPRPAPPARPARPAAAAVAGVPPTDDTVNVSPPEPPPRPPPSLATKMILLPISGGDDRCWIGPPPGPAPTVYVRVAPSADQLTPLMRLSACAIF